MKTFHIHVPEVLSIPVLYSFMNRIMKELKLVVPGASVQVYPEKRRTELVVHAYGFWDERSAMEAMALPIALDLWAVALVRQAEAEQSGCDAGWDGGSMGTMGETSEDEVKTETQIASELKAEPEHQQVSM